MENKIDLDLVLQGYLECAIWTEEEQLKEEKPNVWYNINNFTIPAINQAKSDIAKFMLLAGVLTVSEFLSQDGLNESDLGHNIWLTRNRHGAGFLDYSNLEYGDILRLSAQKLEECNLFVSRGKLTFY